MLLRLYGVSTVNSLVATRSCRTKPGSTPRRTVQATTLTRTVSAASRNEGSRTFANVNPVQPPAPHQQNAAGQQAQMRPGTRWKRPHALHHLRGVPEVVACRDGQEHDHQP